MSRSIRVAAVQLCAHDRADFERAFPEILRRLAEAAEHCDLVVLPEGTIPAYVLGADPIDGAASERALDRIAEIARSRSCVVVIGAALQDGTRTVNAGVVFDRDGTRAGVAEKCFLWHFDARWFQPAQTLAPIATSIGRLGVLICADGRIPTIARSLVDRGAELLVMPTAWVTSGRDPDRLENAQADLIAQVRAYENGVALIASNKCGTEAGFVAYCGKSQIVDAAGTMLAVASEREPQICRAEIQLASSRPAHAPSVHPAQRTPAQRLRVAVSFEPLRADDDSRLAILEAQCAIAPADAERFAALDAAIPSVAVDDTRMRDPAGLVPYRRAGYALALWTARARDGWTERIARTRALELRMYLTVFDHSLERAYVVDPDGAVVCGTFAGYRLASFELDPEKLVRTQVAPNSDILAGLDAVERASGVEARA